MNTAFLRCGPNGLRFSKIWTSARMLSTSLVRCTNSASSSSAYHVCNSGLLMVLRNWTTPRLILASKLCRNYQNFRLVNTSRNRCWHCNAVVAERDLVCLSCGCIQEPRNSLNYFEIFKENPQFDLDTRNLSIKFRRLQNVLHPDKFASRSDMEQKYSMEQSALVNKAYQTLTNPMERGLYLLELHGNPLCEGDVMPTDFLGDVMEINEQIAACKTAECIEPIRHVNDAKLQVLYGELSQAFKERNINRAREILAKLKYYMSIDSQIRKVEDQMGIYRDD